MADVLLRLSLLRSPPHLPLLSSFPSFSSNPPRSKLSRKPSSDASVAAALDTDAVAFPRLSKRSSHFKVHAVIAETDQPKWWQKNAGPNMIDVHSTEEFISALSQAEDKLVIVDFYGTWCGSCRALFPKLCKTAEEHPDVFFIKVNFDENKSMCKRLNVRVLPYFHFYRGADGRLESFSCSLAKFQKIKDAIATHNTARCSIGPPVSLGDLENLLEASTLKDKPAEASSR